MGVCGGGGTADDTDVKGGEEALVTINDGGDFSTEGEDEPLDSVLLLLLLLVLLLLLLLILVCLCFKS